MVPPTTSPLPSSASWVPKSSPSAAARMGSTSMTASVPPHRRRWPPKVQECKADLGVAFDGDGDRLVMVDSTGYIIDGDGILYIIARDALRHGRLKGWCGGHPDGQHGVGAGTSDPGHPLARAKVGDRYVLR